MLPIRPTSRFKKDLKKAKRQRHDLEHLKRVLVQLSRSKSLLSSYKDHKLKGNWQDFRECHIEPDWLMIYTISDFELRSARMGTHSELFD
jgi:mRNA interferase YafQ